MVRHGRNWFDQHGAAYALYRPDYPAALAVSLAQLAPSHARALDVGCGSGQFTCQLATCFDSVIGVDPSADQIAHARPHPRISYRVASAEDLGVASASVDLVTAAQAAHWFDRARFYAEVRRVAVPDGVVALISYGVARLDAELQQRFLAFYSGAMGAYWPPERRLVDEGYAGIDFPFHEMAAPIVDIERAWSAEAFLGYVATWSAVRRAREAGQEKLLHDFAADMLALWGDPQCLRPVRWPVVMRVGRVD